MMSKSFTNYNNKNLLKLLGETRSGIVIEPFVVLYPPIVVMIMYPPFIVMVISNLKEEKLASNYTSDLYNCMKIVMLWKYSFAYNKKKR